MIPSILDYLSKEIATLSKLDVTEITIAADVLLEAIKNGKTIYCFGNGGSAATASHFQNDFMKILGTKSSTKFNFVCLNDNIATIMAVANDIGYDEVFRFQLTDRLQPGDVVIAISGSGNSVNVIKAVQYAKSQGNDVIALTGFNGGTLGILADVHLNAPVDSMQITEDIHLMFNHLLVSTLLNFLS